MWVRTAICLALAMLVAGCTGNDVVDPDSTEPRADPEPRTDPEPPASPVEEADPTPDPPPEYREGVIEIELIEVHPDNAPPPDHEQFGFASSSTATTAGNLVRLRLLDADQPVNASWIIGDGTRLPAANEVHHRFAQEGFYKVEATGADVQASDFVFVDRLAFLSGALPPCPTCEFPDDPPLSHPSPPTRHELHLSNTTDAIMIDIFTSRTEPWFVVYDEHGNERAQPDPFVGLTTPWAHAWITDIEPSEARTWYLDVWGRAGVPEAPFGGKIVFS